MVRRVFLHVGLPKSGTSYLQAVLAANKRRLAERSTILYPGKRWYDQVLAARDVLSANPYNEVDPATSGAWSRLVDEITDWHGDAVISMEWLGSATPQQTQRIVSSFESARVEVIVTARDLGRTLPAAWQEFTQNWKQWTWTEFLGSVMSDRPRGSPAGNMFWAQQDLGRLLAIWTDVLPAEQVHVVTLPRPGAPAGDLWTRFCDVLGIDGSQYDASGGGVNESLGLESTLLMLQLNSVSRAQGVPWNQYDQMFKHALAKRGLSNRRHREHSVRVPVEHEEWVRARAAELVRAVESNGVQVVGELSDLDPVFGQGVSDTDTITSDARLEAAVDGLVALARDRGRTEDRLRTRNQELRRKVRALEQKVGAIASTESELRDARDRPLRGALVGLSEKYRWAGRARRVYSGLRRIRRS